MISDAKLIMIFLLAALVLLPTGGGIKVSVSSDAGSISEEIQADDKNAVKSGTVIGTNSLSHSIEGSGWLKESHSVSNTAGARAEVSANIRNAEWYSYSYDLWPGRGSSWSASRFAQVAASEELDVLNAEYIQAYARALNRKGYTADVNTVIYDPGMMASLSGYRNLAMASKNEAMASQTADGAWAPNGYIQADS
ncbi:MAG: hypothetical protein LUO89_04795, partial [Methanothrix sp.]|nr:hypothetical protein [Methanothrix sp.]